MLKEIWVCTNTFGRLVYIYVTVNLKNNVICKMTKSIIQFIK